MFAILISIDTLILRLLHNLSQIRCVSLPLLAQQYAQALLHPCKKVSLLFLCSISIISDLEPYSDLLTGEFSIPVFVFLSSCLVLTTILTRLGPLRLSLLRGFIEFTRCSIVRRIGEAQYVI